MQLNDIRALVAGDLAAVDAEIRRQLASDVAAREPGGRIHRRRRGQTPPAPARRARRPGGRGDGTAQVPAAALIEFIHTATLLHDDVVDESARRRGRETANEAFGNPASVLVGDFLYSRAFQMMAALDSAAVIRVMADATNTIAAGEVMQLMNSGDPDTTEVRYMEVIYRKTARLFEAGAQIAAIVARAPAPVEAALARLRQASRHRFPADRRRARLRRRRRGTRQERRRRPRRGQADAAAHPCAQARGWPGGRDDPPRHRAGRHRGTGIDPRRGRKHGRARLHGGARRP